MGGSRVGSSDVPSSLWLVLICVAMSGFSLWNSTSSDEMCKGSKAILTLDRRRQTKLRSETEQVMSTTGGMMITLEYQGNTWVLLIHNSAGINYCIEQWSVHMSA